jgi:FMN reductase
MTAKPRIVGLGGTSRPESTSECALRACLARVEALGGHTEAFCSESLDLPLYGTGAPLVPAARRLVEAIRHCDGLVISSPCYHGGVSGAIKNAFDYVEELRDDARPYLDGRSVGVVVCAYGVQAVGTTIVGIRSVVHALRGWPTPLAAGIHTTGRIFDADGRCTDAAAAAQLDLVAEQVWEFAAMRLSWRQRARARAAA